MNYRFPENFLWGTATASHQVEGGNNANESWVLETLPETIYADPSGIACDHFNRYPEDIALLKSLGFNSYRFSLEWSRIEPTEGEFSSAGLEHYRKMIGTCLEHDITPFVTLHHFTTPQWAHRKGGWLDERIIDSFARYTEKVTDHMGDLFKGVATFNEPNIARLLKHILPFSPKDTPFWKNAADHFGVTSDTLGLYQFVSDEKMWDIIHAAHLKARDILKGGPGDFPVGLTVAMTDVHSVEGGEEKALELRKDISDRYVQRLTDDDFVGVQTYSRFVVGPEGIIPPGPEVEITQMHEEFYPAAIEGTIRLASEIAGIPVIVTENGVATEDDTRRVEYYKGALAGVSRCLTDGIDVRGYFAWSAFDNFEWVGGYEPKFGIISVDRETMERTPKPSAYYLGKIAKENGMTL